MKLSTYLRTENISQTDFAKQLGKPQATINRYIKGERFPNREIIAEIEKATEGAVGVLDWYSEDESEGAA